jgi:PAS domain S-box-containing protein
MSRPAFFRNQPFLPDSAKIVRFESPDPLLAMLEESGRFGSFQFHFKTGVLEWSDEMFRRYGFDPTEDLSTDDSMERVHPDDRSNVRGAITDAVSNGSGYTMEYRVLRPDGEIFWLLTRAQIERNVDGAPERILGIALDISAMKKAEAAESETRSQIASLVESVAASFLALDRNWRFTFVNSRVLERTGKTREELIGQVIWDVFPDRRQSWYPEYLRVMRDRVASRFQVSAPQLDGSTAWYDVHAFPTAEGIAALVQDISELKRTENEIRAAADRLRLAQSAGGIGTWDWDFRSNTLHWSDELYEVTGIPKTVPASIESWLSYVHPDDVDALRASFEHQVMTAENPEPVWEYRIVRPDGRWMWVVGRGKLYRDENRAPQRMLGVVADVTKRHLAEEALRRSEKLAATGRLAATISHEINNPLEAITNLLYLSLGDEGLPERVRQYLTDADDELKRVAGIVRQALGFYRDSTTQRMTNLSELVRSVLHLYRKRFETKHVRLITEFDMSLCASVMEGEIKQIVTNFVTNALDATEPGGVIHARVWDEGGKAHIQIEDNGSGIAEGTRLRLFEPFFTTKQNVGTGLGLWISKEIADKHGATIALETSTEAASHGTKFTLSMPLSGEQAAFRAGL